MSIESVEKKRGVNATVQEGLTVYTCEKKKRHIIGILTHLNDLNKPA